MADVAGLRHVNLFRRGGGLDTPPEVALAWPKPNYINPETHGDVGPILIIVFLVISIILYLARMWARVVMSKNAGIDDWIMTAAILPLIGSAVAAVLACRTYGFQWHSWDQTSETLITSRQIILAIEVLYLLTTSLIKISILCFYKRITNRSISTTFIYWIWGSIAFVIAYFFAFSFAILFTCSPVEGYWRYFDISWRFTHELKCHDEGASILVVVVISTIQDFVVCALPVVPIWSLQISKRQKAALCGIFGLGLLTCVCGVMRAYYAIYVYYFTYDITWTAWYGWVWTIIEAELGVMCACAPALKIFFKRYFSLNTSRDGRYDYGTGNQTSTGRITGYGKLSINQSDDASPIEGSKWEPSPVPLNRIQVRTTTKIAEDRDDVESIDSDQSTRYLTALPSTTMPTQAHILERAVSPPAWNGNRTVITADIRDREIDIEKQI